MLTAFAASAGTVYGLSAASGKRIWAGQAGSIIYGPDEQNADVPIGMTVGNGLLVVPGGRVLTASAADWFRSVRLGRLVYPHRGTRPLPAGGGAS